MIKKDYVGLSLNVSYFIESDVITASMALDGIFDDNVSIKDTNWLGWKE